MLHEYRRPGWGTGYRCLGSVCNGERKCKRVVRDSLLCRDHFTGCNIPKPEDNLCAICFEELDEITRSPVVQQSCGHWYHLQCILQSRQSKCPECRQELILPAAIAQEIRDSPYRAPLETSIPLGNIEEVNIEEVISSLFSLGEVGDGPLFMDPTRGLLFIPLTISRSDVRLDSPTQ